MAFWKKSEDPWDVDPEKRRRQPVTYFESEEQEEAEELSVKEMISGLFKKKEEPVEEETPVPCPYCGKTMAKGYLKSGKGNVYWTKVKPGFFGEFDESLEICNEGGLFTALYNACHMCEDCRKLIVDVPKPADAWIEEALAAQKEKEENKE